MNLSEEIIAALRARNVAGETYDRMEKSTGVSGSYIHQLVNRRSDPLKLSLEKFFALFPSAQIILAGSAVSSPACSDDLERVRMESERDRLAHERRELELERRIFELEKQLAERAAISPRAPLSSSYQPEESEVKV